MESLFTLHLINKNTEKMHINRLPIEINPVREKIYSKQFIHFWAKYNIVQGFTEEKEKWQNITTLGLHRLLHDLFSFSFCYLSNLPFI